MIVRDHPALSLSRQCRLLSIGRSSLYYEPKGESAETLALMRRIDELFLKYPFYGARRMALHLRREGVCIGSAPGRPADEPDGASGDLSGAAHQRAPRRATGSGLICSGVWRSSGRTMSGAPTSPTSRCSAASFTWWRSWTGRAGSFWPGVCRTRWTQASAQTRSRKPLARHGKPEIFRHRPGQPVHQLGGLHRAPASGSGIRISMDGRGRCMDNHLHRALVAFAQIRGGLPAARSPTATPPGA